MPSARLEEAENTGCLEMNRVDMDCRPVPQRPAAILNGGPAPVTMRVTDKLRANLAPYIAVATSGRSATRARLEGTALR
jgi:hypothetical protein